jgi:hypothetical protein
MRLTVEQACDMLFRGKSNVPTAAAKCGLSKKEMFIVFSKYAKKIPLTDDAWKGDIMLGWPWA